MRPSCQSRSAFWIRSGVSAPALSPSKSLVLPSAFPAAAFAGGFGEQRLPRRIIDRAAVVGIDQAEIPELRALIDVRHAGHGELQDGLNKAVADAERRDPRLERQERFEKWIRPASRRARRA